MCSGGKLASGQRDAQQQVVVQYVATVSDCGHVCVSGFEAGGGQAYLAVVMLP